MTSTTTVLPAILKTDTKGRVRTPAAHREALMDLFEQGGMSGAAFARLHGLRYSTFAHWRQRRKTRPARRSAPIAFQEVALAPQEKIVPAGLVVELPLGARVCVERADQIPLVAVLCRHLQENAPC